MEYSQEDYHKLYDMLMEVVKDKVKAQGRVFKLENALKWYIENSDNGEVASEALAERDKNIIEHLTYYAGMGLYVNILAKIVDGEPVLIHHYSEGVNASVSASYEVIEIDKKRYEEIKTFSFIIEDDIPYVKNIDDLPDYVKDIFGEVLEQYN